MRNEFFILLLVITSLALVCGFTRPTWCAELFRRLRGWFTALCGVVSRLLGIQDNDDRRWFLIGAAAGVAYDVFCTFATNRGLWGDLEFIGFPFTFFVAGGYVYTVYFSWLAFFADLLVAVLIALAGAYAALGMRTLVKREERNRSTRADKD